jgi:hypothetical protein
MIRKITNSAGLTGAIPTGQTRRPLSTSSRTSRCGRSAPTTPPGCGPGRRTAPPNAGKDVRAAAHPRPPGFVGAGDGSLRRDPAVSRCAPGPRPFRHSRRPCGTARHARIRGKRSACRRRNEGRLLLSAGGEVQFAAVSSGARIYADKPKKFTRRLASRWEAWRQGKPVDARALRGQAEEQRV